MRLLGLSDLHVNHSRNRESLATIPAHPDDWLILGGDLGERNEQLQWVFETLGPKFAQLIWVPGNHELWTPPSEGAAGLRGEHRYLDQVRLCRAFGVLTPEDPYVAWPGDPTVTICPLFLLYDYSFAPPGQTPADAVAWAAEQGIRAADELYLHPDPYPSRQAWCAQRIEHTAARLTATPGRKVLINHWPLRRDLTRIPAVPRYIPWCGTLQTTDWHVRFDAEVVVSGHLHVRATDYRDGVRFEEISLGYPRHWREDRGAAGYLREILPGPPAPPTPDAGPFLHR